MGVVIEHKYSSILFIILTLIALFLDDIRIAFTPKGADPFVDSVFLFCFLAFLIEMVFTSISKNDYLFSFFFWLDLAALISILFDIYYLLDAISVTFQLPTDATNVARAGRAGRAGTRVGRLMKIVRMIRVFRVAKLYKETKRAIDERRKVLDTNKPGDKKVHPVQDPKFLNENKGNRMKKRKNIMINDYSRKMSFMKKIQGVKELIKFDNFESLSSEDPHIAEMKKMPQRMRTQIQLRSKRRRILDNFKRNNSLHNKNNIEEATESDSVNSFSSSSFEEEFKSLDKKSRKTSNK